MAVGAGATAIYAIVAAVIAASASVYASKSASDNANAAFEANQNNAIRSALDQYDALGANANQQRQAAGQESFKNAEAAARARATASTAADASGISGLSVDQVLNEIDMQEGQNQSNIQQNLAFAQDQQQRQGAGINAQETDRINSVKPGDFNPIIGLLQIGAAAGGSYASSQYATKH